MASDAPVDKPGSIAVSVVSHGHGDMVSDLVGQLLDCPEVGQILLTRNIPEPEPPVEQPLVELIENQSPRGFAANHNRAFERCRLPYFCVLNPDIELRENPFPTLLSTMDAYSVALVAPQIFTPEGRSEDSFRRFPILASLIAKAVRGDEGRFACDRDARAVLPDWVAGMFMLLRASDFADIGRFDERYFLYYEDVDLCARLRLAGKGIAVDLDAAAVHRAQRASRRELRHMRWHLASMLRYLWRYRGVTLRGEDRRNG